MIVVVYLMMCCHGDCREGVVSLTHEQSRIVNHPIKPGDVVKVVAFAGQYKVEYLTLSLSLSLSLSHSLTLSLSLSLGTGKTTTLLHFALSHPNHRFLYLVYNKSVQELASKVFPKSNVTCKSLHSLAYEHIGYVHELTL